MLHGAWAWIIYFRNIEGNGMKILWKTRMTWSIDEPTTNNPDLIGTII
jgi:catechol-2,3-dioxygenase